ncbi:MAG: Hsp70 family protein [Zavarzinella sp.]
MSRYLVGIDLGTTNCALAYIDLQNRPTQNNLGLKTFPIRQLVGPSQLAERQLLPSFLYLPGEHDLPTGSYGVPWNVTIDYITGDFARTQGAKIPGRLVSSAKSWLCHAGVDRTSPLLPWGAPPEVQRLSPLEVSKRYLKHLIDCWNNSPNRKPEDHLEHQQVVLTVPASFDDVARNLTQQAATEAGFRNFRLLEEPQAAFYSWMGLSDALEITHVQPGMNCVVIDLGGGTTDFSLIEAVEQQGELAFVRKAVGDHLLLGGDNMDMALARHVEQSLPQVGKLDAAQFSLLVQACRNAKEALLGLNPPPEVGITLQGRGRSVVGGSVHTKLQLATIEKVMLEGFFPLVPANSTPDRSLTGGMQEMGLPYVADPCVSRHLAEFLNRHLSPSQPPDAILFNGGVFQPIRLRDRILEIMRQWYGEAWQPIILTNPSLDLAVAWGAAYSAWLSHTGGKRIGGGIPRSYYVGVASTDPTTTAQVLCIVPRHMQEGTDVAIPKPEMELALGEPVHFPLFSSTVRGNDQPGDIITAGADQLLELPAIQTILRGGKRSGTKTVPVTLSTRCTEIGTLEMYCVGKENDQRWRLEFNVRDIVGQNNYSAAAGEDQPTTISDLYDEGAVHEAQTLIESAFQGDFKPNELTKALESSLEQSRDHWPTAFCRRLWTVLENHATARNRSAQHLSRWYHLVGFCLRPGFGDTLDRYRIDQLWKLLATPGAAGSTTPPGGADYWIMWRRVAGGLSTAVQNTLMNRLRPILIPGKGKGSAKPPTNELAEMWRTAASLERIDLKTKQALGEGLLRQLNKAPLPNYLFWALTRIGSRRLFYGPMNAVLHPTVVEDWLTQLLTYQPLSDTERMNYLFCLSHLGTMVQQRALDIDDAVRQTVLARLESMGAAPSMIQQVREFVAVQQDEQSQLFGESLPIGLRLVGSTT